MGLCGLHPHSTECTESGEHDPHIMGRNPELQNKDRGWILEVEASVCYHQLQVVTT